MFFRKKYLLAKMEVTYGTDPVPVAADAILTSNMTISPYEGNRVSRDTDRAYLGAREDINTGPMVKIEFDVEIAGAGAAGDVPGYGALLRACGMSETINASTDVVYAPISESFESATLYYWMDGQQHVVTGARGTVTLNMQREDLPKFRFQFDGIYNAPTAQATVTPDTSAFVDPLPVNNTNTSLTFFGQAVKTEQVSLDVGNEMPSRFLINADEIIISDRDSSCTLQFEAPDIGTYDFFNDLESHNGLSTGALQVVHGATAGNIFTLDAATVQLSTLQPQDSDGLVAYNTSCKLLPTVAGNDEFTLTVS